MALEELCLPFSRMCDPADWYAKCSYYAHHYWAPVVQADVLGAEDRCECDRTWSLSPWNPHLSGETCIPRVTLERWGTVRLRGRVCVWVPVGLRMTHLRVVVHKVFLGVVSFDLGPKRSDQRMGKGCFNQKEQPPV